jgi:hypothetical protein
MLGRLGFLPPPLGRTTNGKASCVRQIEYAAGILRFMGLTCHGVIQGGQIWTNMST